MLFLPPRVLPLQTEQGWDDAETCAGQLELELTAQGLQFLGLLGRGVSHTFTLCSLFCSSSLFLDLLPFSSPQGYFFLVFVLFFKCLFVRVELARVGVSGYGPLHSPQTERKLRGTRVSCP